MFPFLNLPGELRSRVYDCLLVSSQTDIVSTHPQILAVCKQTYQEGRSILYGDNVAKIEIRRSGFKIDRVWMPRDNFASKDKLKIVWPPFLRRVWRIQITSPDDRYISVKAVATFSNTIYSLACFLAAGHRLRECNIYFLCQAIPVFRNQQALQLVHGIIPLQSVGIDVQLSAPGRIEGRITLPSSPSPDPLTYYTVAGILFDGQYKVPGDKKAARLQR